MTTQYPNLSAEEISVLTEFFHFVDTDKDGFISIEEIKVACGVDLDGNGTISNDEMLKCASVWLNDYLAREDTNNDGHISLHEMLAFNNDNR